MLSIQAMARIEIKTFSIRGSVLYPTILAMARIDNTGLNRERNVLYPSHGFDRQQNKTPWFPGLHGEVLAVLYPSPLLYLVKIR